MYHVCCLRFFIFLQSFKLLADIILFQPQPYWCSRIYAVIIFPVWSKFYKLDILICIEKNKFWMKLNMLIWHWIRPQQQTWVHPQFDSYVFRCVSISISANFTEQTNRQTNRQTLSFVCLCMTVYEYVWLFMIFLMWAFSCVDR